MWMVNFDKMYTMFDGSAVRLVFLRTLRMVQGHEISRDVEILS